MSFCVKLKANIPTLSYEFFPPKNPAGWGTLYSTLGAIVKQSPDYVSVTYGAGGSTRQKTVDLVSRIQSELDIEATAHLTCVGHSQEELADILTRLQSSGVRHVLALRGDAPKGDTGFQPHPDGFAHATDLIAFIKSRYQFHIGCAFYPEKHAEAESIDQDIEYLKMKQDNGAEFAISQLFFDNENFLRFRDQAAAAGVTIPLIAGIMPVTALTQLPRFQQLSGTIIPGRLTEFLGEGADDVIVARGIGYATEQCAELLRSGVAGIHLYTLNKSKSSVKITETLRSSGYFPPNRK